MACIALSFSCTKKEKPEEPPQENETEQTYSLTVSAVRAESFDTRARYIDDPVVKATWAIGEKVKVYKGVAQVGTLTADTEGCGKATLVNCTFTQNSSSNGAGAIGNALGDTELTLENCTIYGNTAGTNGGGIWIHGGTIDDRGDEYAAGIGTGKRDKDWGVLSGIGGGDSVPGYVITINGGYVYAEGKDWGTGIGAGEDGDGATVTINGGIVEAVAGSDAASRGCAFGSEDGEDRKGDIIFANKMSVIAGNTKSTATRFSAGERKAACWYRPYARVEVCTHPGYDKTGCPYCEH